MEKVSFVVACKKFFGILPGQSLMDFQKEIKALTPKDKEELTAMFPSVGFEINAEKAAA